MPCFCPVGTNAISGSCAASPLFAGTPTALVESKLGAFSLGWVCTWQCLLAAGCLGNLSSGTCTAICQ